MIAFRLHRHVQQDFVAGALGFGREPWRRVGVRQEGQPDRLRQAHRAVGAREIGAEIVDHDGDLRRAGEPLRRHSGARHHPVGIIMRHDGEQNLRREGAGFDGLGQSQRREGLWRRAARLRGRDAARRDDGDERWDAGDGLGAADRDGQSEQHEERHIGALHQGARRPGSLAAANRFEPIHGPVERRRAGKSTIHV